MLHSQFEIENYKEERYGNEQKTVKARVREDGEDEDEPSCGRVRHKAAMSQQREARKCDSKEEEVCDKNGVWALSSILLFVCSLMLRQQRWGYAYSAKHAIV